MDSREKEKRMAYLWWVPVQLADAGNVVSFPESVVVHQGRWRGGDEPAAPHALLLPDLIALCQVIPVPANLDTQINVVATLVTLLLHHVICIVLSADNPGPAGTLPDMSDMFARSPATLWGQPCCLL